MVALKRRNNQKHVVADKLETAFAWGAYYANHSDILLNGEKWTVRVVMGASIFIDGKGSTGHGDWVIFENDSAMYVWRKERLNLVRMQNPLDGEHVCMSDETFYAIDFALCQKRNTTEERGEVI